MSLIQGLDMFGNTQTAPKKLRSGKTDLRNGAFGVKMHVF